MATYALYCDNHHWRPHIYYTHQNMEDRTVVRLGDKCWECKEEQVFTKMISNSDPKPVISCNPGCDCTEILLKEKAKILMSFQNTPSDLELVEKTLRECVDLLKILKESKK